MIFGLFRKQVKVFKVKKITKLEKTVKPKPLLKSTPKKKIKKLIKPKGKKLQRRMIKKPEGLKLKRVPPAKIMPRKVGQVRHYFPHVKAAVILVTSGTISLGDSLHIKGHTTNFKQKVTSMQINNVPIQMAKPKDEIGLLVKSRVRHNDAVYKL